MRIDRDTLARVLHALDNGSPSVDVWTPAPEATKAEYRERAVAFRAVVKRVKALPVVAFDRHAWLGTRGCHADDDGDCEWRECPQLRDGEPAKSGRHCPYDRSGENET